MAKSKAAKKILDSYVVKGTHKVVKGGDCVLLRASDQGNPPYVARLEKIEADSRNNVKVYVRWYYRPEESMGGRRQFHGAKELFLSDHFDIQSGDTIEGKCTVHTFKSYTKLESVSAEDYFCRFEYKASTGGFTPDRVAVYCKCEMPYNPDDLMVQCEGCKDWFHPTCMNLSQEQVKKMDHYVCPDCDNGQHDEDKKVGSGQGGSLPEDSKTWPTDCGSQDGEKKSRNSHRVFPRSEPKPEPKKRKR